MVRARPLVAMLVATLASIPLARADFRAALASYDRGEFAVAAEEFELRETIEQTVELFREPARQKSLARPKPPICSRALTYISVSRGCTSGRRRTSRARSATGRSAFTTGSSTSRGCTAAGAARGGTSTPAGLGIAAIFGGA